MRERPKWSRAEKGWMVISCGVVALLIGVGLWRQTADAVPPLHTSTLEMPDPNAFDSYMSAGRTLVRPHDISSIAFGEIALSTQPLPPEGGPPGSFQMRTATPADKAAIVQANSLPLAEFEAASRLKYRERPLRSFDQPLRYYSDFQKLSELKMLQSEVAAAQGQFSEAIEHLNDLMKFGVTLKRGASASSMAVSYGSRFEFRVRSAWWKLIDKLNADELRQSIRYLNENDELQPPMTQLLREAKLSGEASLMEMFDRPRWPIELAGMLVGGCVPQGDWKDIARIRFVGKGGLLHDYSRNMEAAIAEAARPAASRKDIPNEVSLTRNLVPDLDGWNFLEMRGKTVNSLLCTSLALRLYFLEHNRYPRELKALVPAYLNGPPEDHFTVDQQLQYRSDGKKYALYSVGPDQADDNGTPISSGSGETKTYGVPRGAKGDIVAGINN